MAKNKKIENHYHCSECGEVLKEIGRIGWDVADGVRIIYQCRKHIFIWKEENRKLKKIY